jgi:hypothetical protein
VCHGGFFVVSGAGGRGCPCRNETSFRKAARAPNKRTTLFSLLRAHFEGLLTQPEMCHLFFSWEVGGGVKGHSGCQKKGTLTAAQAADNHTQNPSMASDDAATYRRWFPLADTDGDGRVTGGDAVKFFSLSGLPKETLARVWQLSDVNRQGFLGRAVVTPGLSLHSRVSAWFHGPHWLSSVGVVAHTPYLGLSLPARCQIVTCPFDDKITR